jgi:hypothetical protein
MTLSSIAMRATCEVMTVDLIFAGELLGQAACFDTITLEDGTVVKLDVPPVATVEEIAAAEAAVAEQGAAVRALKAAGRGNSDELVQDAVAQLLARKEVLAGMVVAREAAPAKDADIAGATNKAAKAEKPADLNAIEGCIDEGEAALQRGRGPGDDVRPRQ